MNIEQLSTNKLVRSSGHGDLAEMAVVAGSQMSTPSIHDREWPLSKAVFVTLISVGYVCAALAFYFMFSAVHPL
jgi:hypothetical protein